jgi:transposase
MRGSGEVSNEEWAALEPLLCFRQRPDGRGRPPQDTRAVLNGVLWILRTGAQWQELPKKYPPYQTCHRRFQQWVRSGQLNKALRALARELHGHGLLALEEGLLDGTFASAKKGGLAVGLHGPPRLHENHAEVFVSDYSYRSATMGSIFAARRAGI